MEKGEGSGSSKRKEMYSPEVQPSTQRSTGTPPTATPKKQRRGPMEMVINYKETIERLHLIGTSTIDWDTVDTLGMRDELTEYLTQMGLLTFAQKIGDTYPKATKEFFWTMKLLDTSTVDKCKISFVTGGNASYTSVTQICEVFNFTNSEETRITMSAGHKAGWLEMTGCEYSASKATETIIRHPVLRFAHRFIANTLFSRNETGNVTQNEMILLTNPFVRNGLQINLGLLLAKQLNDIKQMAVHYREAKAVVLGLGGIVTPIYKFYASKPLHRHEPLPPKPMDLSYLNRIKFVSRWVPSEAKFGYHYPRGTETQTSLLSEDEGLALHSRKVKYIPSRFYDDSMGPMTTIPQYMKERQLIESQQLPDGVEPLHIPLRNDIEKWLYKNVVKCLGNYNHVGRQERTLENVNHTMGSVDANITGLREENKELQMRITNLERLAEKIGELETEQGKVRRFMVIAKSLFRRWVSIYWFRPRWGVNNEQEDSVFSLLTNYQDNEERPNQQEQEGENNPQEPEDDEVNQYLNEEEGNDDPDQVTLDQ